MTKAELEALVKQQKEELRFCHEVIAKLGADFRAVEVKMAAIAAACRSPEPDTAWRDAP